MRIRGTKKTNQTSVKMHLVGLLYKSRIVWLVILFHVSLFCLTELSKDNGFPITLFSKTLDKNRIPLHRKTCWGFSFLFANHL